MEGTKVDDSIQFSDKFIGFVDILGFKKLVEEAEYGRGMGLATLLEAVQDLGKTGDRDRVWNNGPHVCPQSPYVNRNLDFQLTQLSDSVVVSTEVSPAGVIALVNHCWGAVIMLLQRGILCRGYITRGSIYHTATHLVGTGFQTALEKEKEVAAFKHEANERGTPFVEVDESVCTYVKEKGDKCVQELFRRMVKGDSSVTVLFPFQRIAHSFMIGSFGAKFSAEHELKANNNVRIRILKLKERVSQFVDQANPKAVQKMKHYLAALDKQLEVCDHTDDVIRRLVAPGLAR